MVGLGPRKPPSRKGSLADVPHNLKDTIRKLEEEFGVSTQKLKEISEHFKNELAQGLTTEGGDIPVRAPAPD